MDITQSHQIIENAIAAATPEHATLHVVILYSGGYDSLITAHVAHIHQRYSVWSIDTMLSADGWREYVTGVAQHYAWDHHIYNNETGYAQFQTWVAHHGCPRTRQGHTHAYRRLKERALYAILMQYKQQRHDRVLFLTGIRRAESNDRRDVGEWRRMGHSNIFFANPILYWSDSDVTRYRWDHDLPENPFYATVRGSGDCQCNWGNFITLNKLRQHSPNLAHGRVHDLDASSRATHGYGWDGEIEGQLSMIDDDDDGSFSLCMQCSRDKGGIIEAQEYRALQEGL